MTECRVTRVVTTQEPKQKSQSPLPSQPTSIRQGQNVDAQHCGLAPTHRDVPRGVERGDLPRHLHRAHHHLHHTGQ